MAKNKIAVSFRLTSFLTVLLATVLSCVFHILYMWAASDITVPDVFSYIFQGAYELLSLFAIAAAIASTVYAHAYFGRKTAVRTALISIASFFVGKVVMFFYNFLVNSLTSAQLISGALTYLIELLFIALVIIITLIFCLIFAKKRISSKSSNANKLYSPQKTAISAAGAYIFLLIADLTFVNVIPFFSQYDDPTVSEIKNIISDYLYYIFKLPILILFVLLAMHILTVVTGKLQLKQHYVQNNSKDEYQ